MLAVGTYVQIYAIADSVGHTVPWFHTDIWTEQVCHLPYKQDRSAMRKAANLGLLVSTEQSHGIYLPLVKD